jgi:gliding motility-associated-like protein
MNYKPAIIFAFIFLYVTNWAFAQKENNNWYFGQKAGITFNSGSPIALASSKMNTNEGSISVSDPEGNLLFYSDGSTIWNRNHVPMLNGTGLMGHISATQSVLAVPLPGSRSIYYIFTVDGAENSLVNGLRYSILNLSLDGGLGGITNTKNVLLETPVTEKLTAVRHSNNKDYWILAHKWNSDAFLTYELTSSGISNTAVISNVGSVHDGSSYSNAIGQMKANREGTKIALAIYGLNKFELFDFNAFTGSVSNAKTTNAPLFLPYGVEFSGDGKKLYGSVFIFDQTADNLLQFNLADPAGLNAIYPINPGVSRIQALQIGPDNKIYCNPATNFLAVINDPNSLGFTCDFNKNGISLNGKLSLHGLPNMIITARKPLATDLGADTTLCIGDSFTLGPEAITGNSYLWQDGSTSSTYVVTKPGIYKLRVRNWYFEEEVEFKVLFKDCASVNAVIPNIISPNQDKLNDAFVVKETQSANFELQIFNRWGSLIYKTESYQNDWDARGNSAGLYYYLLRNSETGQTYKGWLEVVK